MEVGSHFVMSVQGWKYPMNRQEIYAAATFARVMNVTRGKDEPPFMLDVPWDTKTKGPDVTPEERAALTAQLRATSAFGQIRNGGS